MKNNHHKKWGSKCQTLSLILLAFNKLWVNQLHFEAQNGNKGATGFGVRLLIEYLKNLS
jgi:hypothetical protein